MRSLIQRYWRKALAWAFLIVLLGFAQPGLLIMLSLVWAFFWALEQVS